MGTEFADTLNEITGASPAAAPEKSQEQAQASPTESGNAFDQGLAARLQETVQSPDKSPDAPEPGGGMER